MTLQQPGFIKPRAPEGVHHCKKGPDLVPTEDQHQHLVAHTVAAALTAVLVTQREEQAEQVLTAPCGRDVDGNRVTGASASTTLCKQSIRLTFRVAQPAANRARRRLYCSGDIQGQHDL